MNAKPKTGAASGTEHLSLDRDLRVTAASDALLAAVRRRREELIGCHIGELIPPPEDAQKEHFQRLGVMAASIAHDCRQLLTMILASVDNALTRLPADLAAGSGLQQAELAGKRALELVGRLLHGGGDDDGAELDLGAVIAETSPLLRRVVGEDIELCLLVEPVWPVRAGRAQVEQILLNLAVNARDAMPDGGTLVLRTDNAEVAGPQPGLRPALPGGDYVLLAFGDSRAAMPAPSRQQLFAPTADAGKVTGLGLATVARIVGRLKGGLRVESGPGTGALFEIFLPRAPSQA